MKKNFLFIALSVLFVGLAFSSCKKDDSGSNPNDGRIDPSTIATANLIAYWGFENSPQDAVGKRGVASSAITYPVGRRGNALQAGPNSYISFNLPATDPIATMTDFTIAMWLKAPALSTTGVPCYFQLSAGDTWNGALAVYQDNNGDNTSDSLMMKAYFQKVGVTWAGQWIAQSNPSMVADKWFHFVINYSSATSTSTIYINGGAYKIVTTSAYGLTTRYQDDPGDPTIAGFPNGVAPLGALNLGLSGGNAKGVIGDWANLTVFPGVDPQDWLGHFTGQIDELRIYNKALSDQEVLDLYNAEVTQIN